MGDQESHSYILGMNKNQVQNHRITSVAYITSGITHLPLWHISVQSSIVIPKLSGYRSGIPRLSLSKILSRWKEQSRWMEHPLASAFLHLPMVPTHITRKKERKRKDAEVQEDKIKKKKERKNGTKTFPTTSDNTRRTSKLEPKQKAGKAAMPKNKWNRQRPGYPLMSPSQRRRRTRLRTHARPTRSGDADMVCICHSDNQSPPN